MLAAADQLGSFGSRSGNGKTPDFPLVYTARGIYRISGDSLNTFTYTQLSATCVRTVRQLRSLTTHIGSICRTPSK